MVINKKIPFRKSIGGKIIIMFSSLIIIIVALLTLVTVYLTRNNLHDRAFDKLNAVREIKSNQISSLMNRSVSDSRIIASMEDTIQIYKDMKQYHDDMKTQENSPLDISTKRYKELNNSSLRPKLEQIKDLNGYYDIFIICWKHGHVLWSVDEEPDLGQNLASGALKDSGLGRLYKKIRETNDVAFEDFSPYAPSGGKPACFLGVPLYINGNPEAVIVLQLSEQSINSIMQERTGMGLSGESYLIGPDYLMRSDSEMDSINRTVLASFKNPQMGNVKTDMAMEAITEEFETNDKGKIIGRNKIAPDYRGTEVFSSYAPINIMGVRWAIFSEIDKSEIDAPITELIKYIIIIAAILLVLAVVASVIFSKTITKPLLYAVSVANTLSENDLSQIFDKKYLLKQDETGLLSHSLNEMKLSLARVINRLIAGVGGINKSSDELNSITQVMNRTVNESQKLTADVASAAEEMNINMSNSAAGIEQTSNNLNTVASASTEMNATINEISQNTEKARSITEQAVNQATDIRNKMNLLGESANEIGNVTETITTISSQTNLLALNATIEAAKAGDAGKGFAVVAGEIKDLAHQTANATEDIRVRIESIQDAVDISIEDIGKIAEVVQNVNNIVNSIAAAIEEQSITTRDITGNINEASVGVEEAARIITESAAVSDDISKNISSVSTTTSEVATESQSISLNTENLNNLAIEIHDIIQQFKI